MGSGSSVDNTPPEVGSGLSPTPAGGGFHNGTPPRVGCAVAVDDAAPLKGEGSNAADSPPPVGGAGT